MRSREVRLAARPDGLPGPEHFDVVTVDLPEPGPGQLLVRNTWLSVDPFMRGKMDADPAFPPPYALGAPMSGRAVGEVVASHGDALPVGTTVRHLHGWREHAVLDEAEAQPVDVRRAPAEAYLGVLGMTGLTAWAGLTRVASVEPGDVVLITAAAGAVGTVAARVARHLGASRVIGAAGGPLKTRRLLGEHGFDAALDHHAGDLAGQLAIAAPEGVDVVFDSVGGEHLEAAIGAARPRGRFALCGSISGYNSPEGRTAGIRNLNLAISRRLTLRGFSASDHTDRAEEWEALAAGWLADGSLRAESTVSDGLDSAVEAFLGLFSGSNTGKALVRL